MTIFKSAPGKLFSACAVATVLSLSSATVSLAQDWPQWRGAGRDGKATGFTAPAAWPTTLTPKWKVDVGSGDSSPALVGDKLYVFARDGADEVTLCLDAATGAKVWSDKYPAAAPTGPSARAHPGPRSSPAIADGKIVTLGVDSAVSCLDAATGKVLWRNEEYKGVPKFFTATSPIIVDSMAIVQLGTEGNGTTVAFDLTSGEAKWKSQGEGPAYASPVLLTVGDSKQIVALTEKSVVGIAVADGKILWKLPFAVSGMAYNAATPIVDGQTIIYTGQGRGTRAVKIEKQGDEFKPTELWSNDKLSPQFNTPVLKDGYLYGLSDKQAFFCIDAKTGATAWTDTIKRGSNYCEIVDAGAVLIALPSTGDLIAFKPDPKAYTEVAKIKVGSSTFAYPVVSGNRIFVRDGKSLELLVIE